MRVRASTALVRASTALASHLEHGVRIMAVARVLPGSLPGPPRMPVATAAYVAGAWIPPAGSPMGLLTWGLAASGGGAHLLHTSVPMGEEAGGAPGDKTSSFRGVHWDTENTSWRAKLHDPETKRQQHIGSYTSEEVAARAYDWAAVKMHGPEYTKRNFPGELISQRPVSLGDERRESKTSSFHGVCWHKGASSWRAQLWASQTKHRHIGFYTCEEDAARAYDHALVESRGPECSERNFQGELIKSAWEAYLWDPYNKHKQHIGYYDYEEDAARAHDYEAVKLHGPGYPKRNFPNELISEPPAAQGRKR
ncbi:hypothetical protein FOA52_000217 [Chlamydomonas sp. UWO 241]|nr:hypothetical protein FOA52_000217 [Chlamydomonas sp. UWO 241]